jgi:hypothetical protein
MFELGLRLAFDKPTVIVKDEKTTYAFDTSAIEHIEYPRDLRFSRIVDFKQKLAEKIKATHLRATTDSTYTTFLKHFGEFKVAKLDKKEVSGQEYIIEELRALRSAIRRIEVNQSFKDMDSTNIRGPRISADMPAVEILPTTPIEVLGLPGLALKALQTGGVSTVGEIVSMNEIDFLKLPASGRRALMEVKEALALRGLSFQSRTSP